MKTTSSRTKSRKARTKAPRYKFDPLWRTAMRFSGCNDDETEQMVRDYIEHGKEPYFHTIDQQVFACAWIIIRTDIDRRRRRNERARERRRQLRARLQAEREATEKDIRKAERLERKAAATRSAREKSKAMRAAHAVRSRIAGRSVASTCNTVADRGRPLRTSMPMPSCLSGGTQSKVASKPPKQRFSDRFRGPGYKSLSTAGEGLP